jgi:2-oxoglutarate dehydrogenase E2 component (dihydrolipoamide succinyltransferase)
MTAGATKVVMPQLGESIVEATIVRWRVKAGEFVERGQTLAEVETDKATSEIPAPRAGTIRELLAPEGAVVPVGAPILGMDDSTGAAPPAGPPVSVPPKDATQRLPTKHLAPRGVDLRGGPIRSSPAVRRLARRYNVDLQRIQGTGKNGRVTRDDVMKAISQKGSVPPSLPRTETTPFETILPHPIAERAEPQAPAYRVPLYKPQPGDRVVPFSRRRQQIAEHMTLSLETSAHVVAVAEIDVSRLIAAKEKDAKIADARGIKLTMMPYFVQHVAKALAEHPELNASVVDRAIVLRAERNIGVAVDTEEGLIVPVLRRADELGLLGIARALNDLADRARKGMLRPDDVSGGSFTISNPGKDGNLFGVSIIRQPEVAILRLGSIVKRAVVREIDGEDAIVVRPMMYAALSYDHRVIDGRTGNAFLHRVTSLVQATTPSLADR